MKTQTPKEEKKTKITELLSKIPIFQDNNTTQTTEKNTNNTETEDTFSFDFTKIKEKIKNTLEFEPEQTNTPQTEKQKEELNIDLEKIKRIFTKYHLLIFLIITITLQFIPNDGYLPWGGIWMRMQTQDLPIIDDFAKNSVHNFYKGQIVQSVTQQYPNLPQENINKLIDEQMNKLIKENSEQINTQIQQTAEYLKDSFRYEENGQKYTMMPDIDPYQFLRLANNYATTGMLGDTIKNGESWDTKILAPIGRSSTADQELHPYVLAYMYKIAHWITPTMPIMQITAYFPILFTLLSLPFAFLLSTRITNTTGGIFTTTLLAIGAAAIGRTQWGHADTDAYNLFFPILISWLFIKANETENNKKKYGLIILNSFIFGLYSYAWVGWWYVFDVLIAALTAQIAYTILFNKTKIKQSISSTTTYFIATFSFVTLFRGSTKIFLQDVFGPLSFSKFKLASQPDLWPNVYTTVAELNPTSLDNAINIIGGKMFLTIAIIGIILLLLNKKITRRNRITYAAYITMMLASTVYATTKGIRFGILTIPPIAQIFGITAGLVQDKLQEWNKNIKIKKIMINSAVILLFAFILMQSGQVESAYSQSKNDLPIMNKAWWNALTAIKENSAPNAIITSWWDFGHHFKYVANRAVTFDGAHQTSPMAHWVGKTLLTTDENEAIGILRMLSCGSRQGFDEVYKQTDNDTIKTKKIIYAIINMNKKEDAKKYLEKNGIKNTEEILNLTHCNPPEDYFITSEDMVGKAGVWSHFGGWNFEKAHAWINLRNTTQENAIQEMINKFNYTQQQAEQTYNELNSMTNEGEANTWISGWPGYMGSDGCGITNTTIECGNGMIINKTTMDATIRTKEGMAKPKSLSYIDEKTQKFTVKEFNDSTTNFAAILTPVNNVYRITIASPEHAKSIFTRLFYFQGYGLKQFKMFNKQTQIVGGGEIIVWKVNWQNNEQATTEKTKK